MKQFNINDYIYLELTDKGRDIYYHRYDEINKQYGKEMLKPHYPEEKDGLFKIGMWEAFELFGPLIRLGMAHPLFKTTIYFNDKDLKIKGENL